jgi:hypothetical protein
VAYATPCNLDAKTVENTVQSHTGELPPAYAVAVSTKPITGDLPAPDREILRGFIHRTARLRIPN